MMKMNLLTLLVAGNRKVYPAEAEYTFLDVQLESS